MAGPQGPSSSVSIAGANGPSGASGPARPSTRLVASWDIPMRPGPGARLELHFVPEDETTILVASDQGMTTAIARFAGDSIEHPSSGTGWLPAGPLESDASMIALRTLQMSGTFCKRQGAMDHAACRTDPVWDEVVAEVRRSHAAAAVMLM